MGGQYASNFATTYPSKPTLPCSVSSCDKTRQEQKSHGPRSMALRNQAFQAPNKHH